VGDLGLTDAAMEAGWQDALELLRAKGLDVDAMLKRAAANLTYWHDHPATEPGLPGVDDGP
jgi:hypothetical protein